MKKEEEKKDKKKKAASAPKKEMQEQPDLLVEEGEDASEQSEAVKLSSILQFHEPEEPELDLPLLMELMSLSKPLAEAVEGLTDEIKRLTDCDHVFISRYVAASGTFVPVTCRSPQCPLPVDKEQKFMSERYLGARMVILEDLSPYHYRLRPDAARKGFRSMAGIPVLDGEGGLYGLVECFSRHLDYFKGRRLENLSFMAGQLGRLWDGQQHKQIAEFISQENAFIQDIGRSMQISEGLLLYRLGEALHTLFRPDGIAVFGVELEVEGDPMQDVMARGFSMGDVNLLRKSFQRDYLSKIHQMAADSGNILFLKHPAGEKTMYIAPVVWMGKLAGMIIYYWQEALMEDHLRQCEHFAARMIEYAGFNMRWNAVYSNMQRITFNDSLTGLTNRRLFDYLLLREFSKAKEGKYPISLFVLDLDHFKMINDQYGHPSGDEILQQISQLLRQSFASPNVPARYGGEEFAVILPHMGQSKAVALAEEFRRKVESFEFRMENAPVRISVSIGIATQMEGTSCFYADPLRFLQAADQALYQAKASGRNTLGVST